MMKGMYYEYIDLLAIQVLFVMNNQEVVKHVKRMKIVGMVLVVFVFPPQKHVSVIKDGLVLPVIKLVQSVMILL